MAYVDLVLVKQENDREYLFAAPAFSHLKSGTRVLLDTTFGEKEGTVTKRATVEVGSDEYEVMKTLAGGGVFRQIKGVVMVHEFKWSEMPDDVVRVEE